jgi:hypothetical protein
MSTAESSDMEFITYFTVDKATFDEGDPLAFVDADR